MNRLRILRVATATTLVVSMAAVFGAPSGSVVVKPRASTLLLASGSGAPGIPVSLHGSIPTDQRTRVRLQRLEDTGFVTVAVAKTDATGRFAFTTHVPDDRSTASYRVFSEQVVTPTRSVVTGSTTRLTQDPDHATKEPEHWIGSNVGGISADGQHVAYVSLRAVFVLDRATGTTTRITSEAVLRSMDPVISDDGRYVTYTRNAPWYTKRTGDVVVWDRVTGATTAVTSKDQGSHADSISGDGRFVAFTSPESELVAHDTNKHDDVFVWDRLSGATRRITDGDAGSYGADISPNGRWVTFLSEANNLVAHDTNDHSDVFVWDARTGKTRRITGGGMISWAASVSADGRFVAYLSNVFYPKHPTDSRHTDVYVWDRTTGKTRRVTAVTDSTASPMISADGNRVVYTSHSTELTPGDGSRWSDVFVWDRRTGTTTRLINGLNALSPVISADGSHIAYDAGELDGINGPYDIYLWEAGQ